MANKDKGKDGPKKKVAPTAAAVAASDKAVTKALKASVGARSKVMACAHCRPHVQDRLYGPLLRVHTVGNAKNSHRLTCTVCGTVTKP